MADDFNPVHLQSIGEQLLPSVRRAGDAILQVHRLGPKAEFKADQSPVTEADRRAEDILLAGLTDLNLNIPIVSEENTDSHQCEPGRQFFLVDPLDGTKEFLSPDGGGNFTVNIALIVHGDPLLGIVFAPALDQLYLGVVGIGLQNNGMPVLPSPDSRKQTLALASRSHRDERTNQWLSDHNISQTASVGSSLKFGMLANGEADVYPRFSPTMEWDTAAGQAVLVAAGGCVTHPDGRSFQYGKPGYRNSPFIARAPGV